MSYEIIQPPFTLDFETMSKQELKEYFSWFQEIMPLRIRMLSEEVHLDIPWVSDFSPSSLDHLGGWFARVVESRPRSKEEIEGLRNQSAFPIEIPKTELTNRTFSLAMDIGFYLAKVFLHNYPSLHWKQDTRSKRSIDYGQPVLAEFQVSPFNPVRFVITLA